LSASSLRISGHIHGGYGITISDEIPETTFLNVSVCTEGYRPANPPMRFVLGR
jgi:hypothetical protein